MTFVDNQNNVIQRTIINTKQHPLYVSERIDLTVGLLDFDVPTNQVSFAKVLPDNYQDYIRNGRGLPCIRLDQEEKALVGDVETIFISPKEAKASIPYLPNRLLLFEKLADGDSGNPMFIIINNQPILLTVWLGSADGGGGASVTKFKDDINDMMNVLGGGYQLEEIDLSWFTVLPTP